MSLDALRKRVKGLMPQARADLAWESAPRADREEWRRYGRGAADCKGNIGDEVSDMIWARPAVTVLGIDCPPVAGSSAVIQAHARALVSLRIPPGTDTKDAEDALVEHLTAVAPWHVHVEFEREYAGAPFTGAVEGLGFDAMAEATQEVYRRDLTLQGDGGSIPLCNVLQETFPTRRPCCSGSRSRSAGSTVPTRASTRARSRTWPSSRHSSCRSTRRDGPRRRSKNPRSIEVTVSASDRDDPHVLQTFVVELGAALSAAGEPVYAVQERLTRVARAYGARAARISAFPTYMMVTMGRGEAATVELTSGLAALPRLDQIAAVERLAQQAERGAVPPTEGRRALADIRDMGPRFGPAQSICGYAVLTLGLCLILHPAPRDVAAAAVLGALVGVLRSIGRDQPQLQILMPVLAAVSVAALGALAVKHDLTGPGLRAMVASLVVFLPGAALTTSVLELAAGQMISGASRLVSGLMQLALLSFGIVAGIEAVGVSPSQAFSGSDGLLGDWAPWLGVLVFAAGVTVAHSAPARSFPGLLVVLYAAWTGQYVGNAVLGGYVSALVGAAVMTPVAFWVSRLRSAMPPSASFLPGFWLLVPGALGLIGLTQVAGDADAAGTEDLVATVVTIFAIAVGVLLGTLLLAWAAATGKFVGEAADSLTERSRWLKRRAAPHGPPASSGSDDQDARP